VTVIWHFPAHYAALLAHRHDRAHNLADAGTTPGPGSAFAAPRILSAFHRTAAANAVLRREPCSGEAP
jgi:hypothetical protein